MAQAKVQGGVSGGVVVGQSPQQFPPAGDGAGRRQSGNWTAGYVVAAALILSGALLPGATPRSAVGRLLGLVLWIGAALFLVNVIARTAIARWGDDHPAVAGLAMGF